MLSPASRYAFFHFFGGRACANRCLRPIEAQQSKTTTAAATSSATPPSEPPEESRDAQDRNRYSSLYPIIATNRDGLYITDLSQEEFKIFGRWVCQRESLSSAESPLPISRRADAQLSSSSTKNHLRQIQNAAFTFSATVPAKVDRVKIITFDRQG